MPAALFLGFATWLGQFLMTIVVGVLAYVFSDVIFGVVAQLFTLISSSVADVTGLPDVSAAWGDLPIEMLQMCKRIGLDTAMSIIVAAVSVRWAGSALQFVRGLRRGVTP